MEAMMRLLVREVAEREGIRNALDLAQRTGLHYATVYRLWKGEAKRFDIDTIDKLCTLLNVKPGQLFEHIAEPDILPTNPKKTKKPAIN
jgi:DNA-binding Xre family transcriptional regulator